MHCINQMQGSLDSCTPNSDSCRRQVSVTCGSRVTPNTWNVMMTPIVSEMATDAGPTGIVGPMICQERNPPLPWSHAIRASNVLSGHVQGSSSSGGNTCKITYHFSRAEVSCMASAPTQGESGLWEDKKRLLNFDSRYGNSSVCFSDVVKAAEISHQECLLQDNFVAHTQDGMPKPTTAPIIYPFDSPLVLASFIGCHGLSSLPPPPPTSFMGWDSLHMPRPGFRLGLVDRLPWLSVARVSLAWHAVALIVCFGNW